MADNLRESFRIDADSGLEAELFHEGRVSPCAIHNLSAGGARVTSAIRMPQGTQCTLGVRLGPTLRTTRSTPPYVSFLMEVLEASPDGMAIEYRLRSTTGPGSAEYEAAAKLVFSAQRAALAKQTGVDESSPMVSDEDRREKLRPVSEPRFSKKSLRPDTRD